MEEKISDIYKKKTDVMPDDALDFQETPEDKKLEKEKDEEAVQEALGNVPTLEEVYEVYKKWLHIEDTKRLDIGFAVALTRKMEGTPVWLIIVGPSGDFKSEQIRALHHPKHCVIIQRFTSKTLISGDKKVKQGDDFCVLFNEDKEKLMLIYDMAQMLKLPTIEKAEVWAQLRDLYDGSLRRMFGNRVYKIYENLRVTVIAGATPHIDSQILIHQDLGTRELIYRTENIVDYDKIMNMVLKNESAEEEMKKELHEITQKFLIYKNPKELLLTDEHIKKIRNLVKYLAVMRAVADTDSFSGEVRADVGPEMPTRCVKQLKRIFVALKSLKDDYPDERAFDVLKHIILSSCSQNRVKIYHYIRNNITKYEDKKSTYEIAKEAKLGKKTVFKEISILNNLGLIKHDIFENQYGRVFDYWYYDENCREILNLRPLKATLKVVERGKERESNTICTTYGVASESESKGDTKNNIEQNMEFSEKPTIETEKIPKEIQDNRLEEKEKKINKELGEEKIP